MRRRDWLKSAAGLGAAAHLARPAMAEPRAYMDARVMRWKLRHTWTTVMSSSQFRDNVYVRYTADDVTGHGEGAPIVRYHENAESARKTIRGLRPFLASAEPWEFTKVMAEVFRRQEGEWAAKAAIDIALMDWMGKMLGVPLYRYFGLDPRDAPGHHLFDRYRHARNYPAKSQGGGRLSRPQDQGRAEHGRSHHRGGPQCNEKAAARGRQ